LKASTFPMPGQESLRTSLCTPSADSFLAMSGKSALGETSNDSRSSFGSPPYSSVMVKSPVFACQKSAVMFLGIEHEPCLRLALMS
jgi:hypothetical protein